MPELPDVNLYIVRLRERVLDQTLLDFKLYSPFVLRSVGVPPQRLQHKTVRDVFRMGKRIVFAFDEDLYLLVHLMIAGRFVWTEGETKTSMKPAKIELARLSWPDGVLTLQEASPKKRAGIWVVEGEAGLLPHRRAGMDIFSTSEEQFKLRLQQENQWVKRALTDPNSFDGIGNAYSDEILFDAKLSPARLTRSLNDAELERLLASCRRVLQIWTNQLLRTIPRFPKSSEVTAFRKNFNVHGRYNKPCNVCGAPIQRIVASENEMNYCARCQNNDVVLADRSLSRLLKENWPKNIEELMS